MIRIWHKDCRLCLNARKKKKNNSRHMKKKKFRYAHRTQKNSIQIMFDNEGPRSHQFSTLLVRFASPSSCLSCVGVSVSVCSMKCVRNKWNVLVKLECWDEYFTFYFMFNVHCLLFIVHCCWFVYIFNYSIRSIHLRRLATVFGWALRGIIWVSFQSN